MSIDRWFLSGFGVGFFLGSEERPREKTEERERGEEERERGCKINILMNKLFK